MARGYEEARLIRHGAKGATAVRDKIAGGRSAKVTDAQAFIAFRSEASIWPPQ